MIDLNATNEWQHRDPATGLVFPWYTKSFLDDLATWDLSDKVIFEYGAGASTLWWAKKARQAFAVESDWEYCQAVRKHIDEYFVISATLKEHYSKFINLPKLQYDIVIIDGEPIEWRDDCVEPALECLKPGGKLIIDNWMQPSVGWLPREETQKLLSQYPVKVYPQEGHRDWKTAVFLKTGTRPDDPLHELNRYVGNYKAPNQYPDSNQ